MKNIKDILKVRTKDKDYRNIHEHQAYGNRLAEEFDDTKHRSLYIKLAKNENRDLLEKARDFVLRSENTVTKGRLFMWKLTELKGTNKDIIKDIDKNKGFYKESEKFE